MRAHVHAAEDRSCPEPRGRRCPRSPVCRLELPKSPRRRPSISVRIRSLICVRGDLRVVDSSIVAFGLDPAPGRARASRRRASRGVCFTMSSSTSAPRHVDAAHVGRRRAGAFAQRTCGVASNLRSKRGTSPEIALGGRPCRSGRQCPSPRRPRASRPDAHVAFADVEERSAATT